ncbi:iron chelate uptake ABC transporter family permease subunit [Sporomusa ovata]|uniref:Uncharacterized protein n=1 Tax=Sporomusa ovata TaxID=2378 RepID=A0A0U1L167_9FIRM|nr:iron chelate uptake ABC transporter family permease subunit [Sporomusa ovata]CQR73412.1 hypothetical protein SpAn4DRAFT_2644 [Sporomusa ovata]
MQHTYKNKLQSFLQKKKKIEGGQNGRKHKIRLPRIIAALLVGAALATSGAATRGYTKTRAGLKNGHHKE